MDKHYALAREAILAALTAYTGITTDDGATPVFNTLVCADLIDSNDFITEKMILIGSGDAKFEDSGASSFVPGTGTITVVSPFSHQIKKGTIFRVLNISTVEMDVAAIDAKIGAEGDAAGTNTLFAWLAKIFADTTDIGAIFDLVNAMLMLTETGGTVTATGLGTEDDVYVNNAPAGEFDPRKVVIDLSDLSGGETATIRTRYRIKSGGDLRLKGAPVIFPGVQAEPLKNVELEPNRFGIAVTVEATIATVMDWEAHYEE